MGPCDCHSSDEIWSHFWVALSLAGDATHSISIRGSSSAPSRCWVEKVQVKICWTFNYRFKRKAILLYFERDSQVCKFWVTFWLPSKRFEWKSRPRKKEKEKEGEKDRYREKERELCREREGEREREWQFFENVFLSPERIWNNKKIEAATAGSSCDNEQLTEGEQTHTHTYVLTDTSTTEQKFEKHIGIWTHRYLQHYRKAKKVTKLQRYVKEQLTEWPAYYTDETKIRWKWGPNTARNTDWQTGSYWRES